MKLLFFSATLKGGGAERVLVNLTNELAKRGHDITIALNKNESYYEVDSRIKIVSAPQRKWYGGRSVLRRLVRNVAIKRHNYRHTRDTIHSVRPDVIISFLWCNMWPIIRWHGNIPIVHSEHNAFDRKLGFHLFYHRFVFNRFFDKICVLTPFDQGYASAKGLKKTIVMPNPNTFIQIDEDEYKSTFTQRKNILVCGRINYWHVKGLDLAIEAFARIANRIPGVDLDIAGSGEEKSLKQLEQLATKLGVEDRVHFLGQRSDMQNVMRQHQLFVLSSRTEGFPMVITEAMSQGLPCVSFEKLASSIIIHSIDGVLVKDGNVAELSEAVLYLISNQDTLFKYGLEAIKNVNRFSAVVVANRWETLFQQLINKTQ